MPTVAFWFDVAAASRMRLSKIFVAVFRLIEYMFCASIQFVWNFINVDADANVKVIRVATVIAWNNPFTHVLRWRPSVISINEWIIIFAGCRIIVAKRGKETGREWQWSR
jgi:hypothetical protein